MLPKNCHTTDLGSCTPDSQRFVCQSVANTFVNIFVSRGRRWPKAIKQTTETVQNLTSILKDETLKLHYTNTWYTRSLTSCVLIALTSTCTVSGNTLPAYK